LFVNVSYRISKWSKGIISNNNVGGNAAGSQTLYIDNNSSGTGIQIKNFSSGTAVFAERRRYRRFTKCRNRVTKLHQQVN
jgi:hypothetical protein